MRFIKTAEVFFRDWKDLQIEGYSDATPTPEPPLPKVKLLAAHDFQKAEFKNFMADIEKKILPENFKLIFEGASLAICDDGIPVIVLRDRFSVDVVTRDYLNLIYPALGAATKIYAEEQMA